MTHWYCIVPTIIAVIIGYVFVFALCKAAADADRTMDELLREQK